MKKGFKKDKFVNYLYGGVSCSYGKRLDCIGRE